MTLYPRLCDQFEEVEQLQLSNLDQLEFDKLVSNFAIVRFVRERRSEFELDPLEKEDNERLLLQRKPVSGSDFSRAGNHAFEIDDVNPWMESYEHHLRLIIRTVPSKAACDAQR